MFLVHLYILELLSIKQEYFHKNVLVTSAKKITRIDRKICSGNAKNQINSMFGRMFSQKLAADKTEISDLHFTLNF